MARMLEEEKLSSTCNRGTAPNATISFNIDVVDNQCEGHHDVMPMVVVRVVVVVASRVEAGVDAPTLL